MLGHHHWELDHGGQVLMRVQYGLPSLPNLPFDEDKFRTDLPRVFQGITATNIDRLVDLVRIAERETHGTMLVITEAAARESERLAPQGTPVGPFLLRGQYPQELDAYRRCNHFGSGWDLSRDWDNFGWQGDG